MAWMLGSGFLLQQIPQQRLGTTMLVKMTKTMRHAAMSVEEYPLGRGHAPLLEFAASLHEKFEEWQGLGRVTLPQ